MGCRYFRTEKYKKTMKYENKVFALVDVNNCYVSCERMFNPSLRDKPVIVLSNNDGCAKSSLNEDNIKSVELLKILMDDVKANSSQEKNK